MSLLRWIDRAEAACVVGAGMAGRDAADDGQPIIC
jgi:hypothetical protein